MNKKTVLEYRLNKNYYINNNTCDEFIPGFLKYNPTGVLNIDIENQLRSSTRLNTKCIEQPTKLKNP